MKNILALLLAVLGVLCLSSMTSAGGFTVQADGGLMNRDVSITTLTLGSEYELGSFFLGGSYSFALSHSPAPPAGTKRADDLVFIYGGWTFLAETDSSLALVGGYSLQNKKLAGTGSSSEEKKTSSICIGGKATVNLEPMEVSVLVLYGISGEYKSFVNGAEVESSDDVSLLYLELKGSYQFTGSLGTFATCRIGNSAAKGVKTSILGLGLGAEYRF